MDFGFTMMCEQTPPKQLVADLVQAEAAGFDFSVISDHYFPWVEEQGHSAYAWSVLGAAAHATEQIPLMTFVTCPIMRYHPAVVAQKAATMGVLSDGRFTLGLGAGENLNEHVVGGGGWPSADTRHEMLAEAVEIISELFEGGYVNYRGEHFDVGSARLYDLPDERVPIAMAAFGRRSTQLAREYADALVSVEPDATVVSEFRGDGRPDRPCYGRLPVSYDTDRDAALQRAHRLWSWGAAGWKVMAELPGPANFEAYTKYVRPEDLVDTVPHGPNVETYLEAVTKYAEAGFTHLALVQIGADRQKEFLAWAEAELLPALREAHR